MQQREDIGAAERRQWCNRERTAVQTVTSVTTQQLSVLPLTFDPERATALLLNSLSNLSRGALNSDELQKVAPQQIDTQRLLQTSGTDCSSALSLFHSESCETNTRQRVNVAQRKTTT